MREIDIQQNSDIFSEAVKTVKLKEDKKEQ